jgi:uncharacterized repeat protein (TIGR03843 family)
MLSENMDQHLTAMKEGKLSLQGEFMWGSNYTFLLKVEHPSGDLQAVYKPTQGVRPLWDFPSATLANREIAAYIVSEALGWDLIPATIFREDGPYGAGSLQLFVEHDPEYHYFNFNEEDKQRLRPVVLFDYLINNADRKGSHVILDADNHIWLIDHGICFHVEDKLRTVIWDFEGTPIPKDLINDIEAFAKKLSPTENHPANLVVQLSPYLNKEEINALAERAKIVMKMDVFIDAEANRRPYPWPPV